MPVPIAVAALTAVATAVAPTVAAVAADAPNAAPIAANAPGISKFLYVQLTHFGKPLDAQKSLKCAATVIVSIGIDVLGLVLGRVHKGAYKPPDGKPVSRSWPDIQSRPIDRFIVAKACSDDCTQDKPVI
jgi:hypothetical protein